MLENLFKPMNLIKSMLAIGAIWFAINALHDTQAAYVEFNQDYTWADWESTHEASWDVVSTDEVQPPQAASPPWSQSPNDDSWTDPSIPENVLRWIRESFPTDERGFTIYPDYFGGMYIDHDNNGRVVLLRVVSSTEPMPTFTNFPDVYVRDVEFSYNELFGMLRYLGDNAPRYINNSSGWFLDAQRNRIIINLIEYNDGTIADFISRNEVFESHMFVFEQGDLWQGLPPPEPLPLPPGVEDLPESGELQPPRDDFWTDPNVPEQTPMPSPEQGAEMPEAPEVPNEPVPPGDQLLPEGGRHHWRNRWERRWNRSGRQLEEQWRSRPAHHRFRSWALE